MIDGSLCFWMGDDESGPADIKNDVDLECEVRKVLTFE
jgi:hypothetical protein